MVIVLLVLMVLLKGSTRLGARFHFTRAKSDLRPPCRNWTCPCRKSKSTPLCCPTSKTTSQQHQQPSSQPCLDPRIQGISSRLMLQNQQELAEQQNPATRTAIPLYFSRKFSMLSRILSPPQVYILQRALGVYAGSILK